MALTYRTPLEEVLSSFTTSEQSLISATAVDRYRQLEKENFGFYNYAMEAHQKEQLARAGVYLSPFSGISHSHPVCKTLENYILYTVLPSYINSKFYLVGIKQSKVNFLRLRDPSVSAIGVINRYVTSQDKLRYGADFVCATSGIVMPEGLSRFCAKSDTLKELLPACIKVKARSLFLHDELHYWSRKDLKVFLGACKPEVLLGTLIYPPELLIGCPESLHPWCYKYTIFGKKFEFAPDGEYTESYMQNLESGFLLRCNKIVLDDGTVYCVDVVVSKFAHHLISITRGDAVTKSRRSFSGFEATTCTGLANLADGVNKLCIRLPCDVTIAIYKYLKTLQKPDVQSAVAKLGQLVRHPTAYQIRFVREFAALVIKTPDGTQLFSADCMASFKLLLANSLPRALTSRIKALRNISFSEFVNTMQPFGFSIRLTEIDSIYDDFFSSPDDWCTDKDPAIIIDNLEGFNSKFLLGDETPQDTTYETFGFCDTIEVNPEVIVRCLLYLLVKSHCYHSLCRFTVKSLATYVSHVFRRAFLGPSCLNALSAKWYSKELMRQLIDMLGNYKPKIWYNAANVCWFLIRRNQRKNKRSLEGPTFVRPDSIGEFSMATTAFDAIDKAVRDISCNPHMRLYRNLCASAFAIDLAATEIPEVVEKTGCLAPRLTDAASQPRIITRMDLNKGTYLSANEEVVPIHNSSVVSSQKTVICGGNFMDSTSGVTDEEWVKMIRARKRSQVKCSCGRLMEKSELLGEAFLPRRTPDKLRMRQAAWYTRDLTTAYSYNGGAHSSLGWDLTFDKIMIINDINADDFDCCLAQKYEAGGAIGFHADDEAIFQKGGPILTVNAFGSAMFRVRCGGGSGEFRLEGGEFFTMPEGFQEDHKHSVSGCTVGRMSFTFRKLATIGGTLTPANITSGLESVPLAESELVLENLERNPVATETLITETSVNASSASGNRATAGWNTDLLGAHVEYDIENECADFLEVNVVGDGSCFYHAVGYFMNLGGLELKKAVFSGLSESDWAAQGVRNQSGDRQFAEVESYCLTARKLKFGIRVHDRDQGLCATVTPHCGAELTIDLILRGEHFLVALPRNGCVVAAICEALGRSRADVLRVLSRKENVAILEKLNEGKGLTIPVVELAMKAFGICASVSHAEGEWLLNSEGKLEKCFTYMEDHLSFVQKQRGNCFSTRKETVDSRDAVNRSALALLDCSGSRISGVFELSRANKLIESLHNGLTGILSSELFNSREKLKPICESVRLGRPVTTILGTFGCGKSTLYKSFFQRALGKFVHFVSPRKALAKAFKDELDGLLDLEGREISKEARKGWSVCTFETFLLNSKKVGGMHVVILDEVQLFPPGYLDLLAYLLPSSTHIYLAGDPCQSEYDNERDRAFLESLGDNLVKLLGDKTYRYATLSHRFTYEGFKGRLPCEFSDTSMDADGAIELHQGLEGLLDSQAQLILVSSFVEKNAIKAYAPASARILTFGESTGLTVDHCALVVSQSSVRVSEVRWLTALSRARKSVSIYSTLEGHESRVAEYFDGRVLSSFLRKTAKVEDLVGLLPGRPNFVSELMPCAGADFMVAEEKLMGDPWLKSAIFLGQSPDVSIENYGEFEGSQEVFRTHLMRSEMESSRVAFLDRMLAKEHREKRMGRLISDQFSEDHSKNNGFRLTNAAERFEAIYPRHRGSDTVTFVMAARKRLRFSKPSIEMAKLADAKMYGPFMLEEFLKLVPLKPGHNKVFMEQALLDFEKKKISKSAATIENHAGRSNSDWPIDTGLVFMKSQHCTKFGNRCQIAKAAQSIVCFQHFVLCRFAPYMRYIEMKLQEAIPANFYIHSGKGLDELDAWVKTGRFEGICTESDYEAFDASQDQFIMAFELEIMRYLNLPIDLINDYIFIKTHLGSKLGNFAIMRFSGEASTFLFNTMANMLFTFLRYDLNGKEFICFAGDDMCAAKRLRHRATHEEFLSKLKLKAKVDFTKKPTFCGWNLCSDGIYKKPQLIYERMCIALETNNLASCLDNYALEVSYAYKLGERAVNRMDEEEMASHYNCVRLIVKKKHLLKSGVADLFRDSLV